MKDQKTALITGATSGIGLETAKGLISQGFFVIGTSRSDEKETIAKKRLGDKAVFIRTDLSSQKSIRNLAERASELLGNRGLDALVNNAGSFYSYYTLSEEGIEKQFAVNTIAPFCLSLLFYDKLKAAGGRVINVSSSSHYGTKIKLSDIQLSRRYGQLKAYKQTKLMSIMLSKRFNEISDDVKTYMADPGFVNTDIGFKNTAGLAKLIWKLRKNKGQSSKQGAQTSIYLASEQDLPEGFYFKDCKNKKPSKEVENRENVKIIWEYCQKVLGLNAKEIILSNE